MFFKKRIQSEYVLKKIPQSFEINIIPTIYYILISLFGDISMPQFNGCSLFVFVQFDGYDGWIFRISSSPKYHSCTIILFSTNSRFLPTRLPSKQRKLAVRLCAHFSLFAGP
jgi:hypothetical protein